MSEREKLLGRVRMYDFALVEVIEYLDCHPHNEAALKYYREMRAVSGTGSMIRGRGKERITDVVIR